jgi:hypothetical protein
VAGSLYAGLKDRRVPLLNFADCSMPRCAATVMILALLAGCAQQSAPIFSPPPGGHDALSKPPAALLSQ